MTTMSSQSYCHKNVQLSFATPKKQQPPNLYDAFALLASKYSKSITTLCVDWLINTDISVHHEFFKILKTFTNLKALQIRPYVIYWQENTHFFNPKWFEEVIPPSFYLPKVTNLLVNVNPSKTATYGLLEVEQPAGTLLPTIIARFPRLTSLGFENLCANEPDTEEWCQIFRATPLTSLSIQNTTAHVFANYVNLGMPPASSVTRLELNTCSRYDVVAEILTKLAPTLTYLHFFGVGTCKPDRVQEISMPALPKLRVLKVTRAPYSPGFFVLPKWKYELEVKFKFGEVEGGLDYRKYLPSLEKIGIKKAGSKGAQKGNEVDSDGEFFEVLAKFLYVHFLREDISPCRTLHQLDIPFPPGLKFRAVKVRPGCQCQTEDFPCRCWEWRSTEEFYGQVRTTFPNLEYQILDSTWWEERKKELGVIVGALKNVGYLEDDIYMMMRNGKLGRGWENLRFWTTYDQFSFVVCMPYRLHNLIFVFVEFCLDTNVFL